MVDSEKSWDAVASFCEEVIAQKEVAERIRESDPEADPIRKKRGD